VTAPEEELGVKISAEVAVSAQATVRHSFTRQHFRAASFFAESAEALEREISLQNRKNDARKSQHRAYVVGTIVSAVMGLEACINEIYLDACDKSQKNLAGLDDIAMSPLSEWWPEVERGPILLKYQRALSLPGRLALPKEETPYQDTDHLIHLRNALTHYKPEWDDSLDVHASLEARLTGKFALNPLSTEASLWFPHRCLGSGCAHWAVKTAEDLVREFAARLGIAPRI
jgi:hypothetical protein